MADSSAPTPPRIDPHDPACLPTPDQTRALGFHIDAAFEEICHQQRVRLLNLARTIEPRVTFEDILNPQSFDALMQDMQFNYEDGYLAGLLAAQTSLKRKVLRPLEQGTAIEPPILPEDSPFRRTE